MLWHAFDKVGYRGLLEVLLPLGKRLIHHFVNPTGFMAFFCGDGSGPTLTNLLTLKRLLGAVNGLHDIQRCDFLGGPRQTVSSFRPCGRQKQVGIDQQLEIFRQIIF